RLLLDAVNRRVVLLHAFGRVTRGRPRDDGLHVRAARQIVELPAETPLREVLAKTDALGDIGKRAILHRRERNLPVTLGKRRSLSCISGVTSWVSTCQRRTVIASSGQVDAVALLRLGRSHDLVTDGVRTTDEEAGCPRARRPRNGPTS